MSYSDDAMRSLMYRIRDLNENLETLKTFNNELELSNQLRILELKLQLGTINKEEAKIILNELVPTSRSKQKTKTSFWNFLD